MKFSTPTDISKFDPEQQDALLAEIQAEALRILRGEGMPDFWRGEVKPLPESASEGEKIIWQRQKGAAIDARPARDASFASGATMFASAAQARESLSVRPETFRVI